MNKIGTLLENMTPKKAGYTILALLVGSLLLFSIFSSNSNGSIDSYPIEGSDQDYSKRARLVNSEDLFKQLGGDKRYDSLSEDLYVFATSAYAKYKTDKPEVIGFVLSGKSIKKDDTITFEGTYGAVKNKVKVGVSIKKNDRITTSIVDTKTKFTIDTSLPSNRKINKYISELPKSEETYIAEYVRSTDKISIFINERRPELLEKALADIESYIDDGSYESDRIEILFPPDTIGQ